MKVTDKVSLLKPCDKNIDVETERAYNRDTFVTIEAYGIDMYFGMD
jgi:hypothetical protein